MKKNIDLDLDELLDKHYYQKKEKELKERNVDIKNHLPKIEKKEKYVRKEKPSRKSTSSDRKNTHNNRSISNDKVTVTRKINPSFNIKDKISNLTKKGKVNPLDTRGKKPKKQTTIDRKKFKI